MPVYPATPPRADCRGSNGRSREGTDAVIVELGANDMLRGIDPKLTREALDAILAKLKERNIAVLLCRHARRAQYAAAITCKRSESIFDDLARKIRRRFLSVLSGWVSRRRQNSSCATACIRMPRASTSSSRGILPKVEELIARVSNKRRS